MRLNVRLYTFLKQLFGVLVKGAPSDGTWAVLDLVQCRFLGL